MAEQVQASLDQMVAPLADLMDRNIFSQDEIHSIVARRRESEYLLRRRAPRKADFLKYIQDEIQLEKLRQLRTKKQQALERERLQKLGRLEELDQLKSNGPKKHIGDYHIVQNIHLLFKRALRRYNKEDVSVYLQYAQVCKDLKSFNKLSQVYAEAVQIHPHCTGLWIEAASHEFFHRQSVNAARILLQRALRINQKAKDLWWQSFALEFHYIAKMQGRRMLLHTGKNTEAATDKSSVVPVNPNLLSVAKIVFDNAIQAIPEDVSFRLGFLDMCQKFPFTESIESHIFKTIRRDFKSDPKAWIAGATQLLEKKKEGIDNSNEAMGFVVEPENEDSSDEAKSKDGGGGGGDDDDDSSTSSDSNSDSQDERPKKKHRIATEAKETFEDPVLAMIRKAIEAVGSSEMYLEAIHFLWKYWEQVHALCDGDADKVESSQQQILHFIKGLLDEVASKDLSVYNTLLALERADFYTRVDQTERARQVLIEFKDLALGEEENIRLTPVWVLLSELTYQVQSAAAARAVLKQALKHTSMSDPDYLKILLQILGLELVIENSEQNGKASTSNATETFQKILLLAAGESGNADKDAMDEVVHETSFGIRSVEQACWQFLLHMIDAAGPVDGARKTWKMILHQSKFLERNVNGIEGVETLASFFDKCLEIEIDNLKKCKKLPHSEKKKIKVCVRQLFEAAISAFKGVPSLASKFQQQRLETSLL